MSVEDAILAKTRHDSVKMKMEQIVQSASLNACEINACIPPPPPVVTTCYCDVGDARSDTPLGVVEVLRDTRNIANSMNSSMIAQSNDRACRFAVEGVRHISACENMLGIVEPRDVMAVAYVVCSMNLPTIFTLHMYDTVLYVLADCQGQR